MNEADSGDDERVRAELDLMAYDEAMDFERRRSQKFFSDLAASIRAPAYAERQRQWVEQILNRATEAGLFTPGAP